MPAKLVGCRYPDQRQREFPTQLDGQHQQRPGFRFNQWQRPGNICRWDEQFWPVGTANTNPAVLTDGTDDYFTYASGVGNSELCSCGTTLYNAGTAITYTLNTSLTPNGFDLTNITVYGGWPDAGRKE